MSPKSATRARVTAAAKAHEQATTNQVAVLTVPTIGDESIGEYALEVFETWKLGQHASGPPGWTGRILLGACILGILGISLSSPS